MTNLSAKCQVDFKDNLDVLPSQSQATMACAQITEASPKGKKNIITGNRMR